MLPYEIDIYEFPRPHIEEKPTVVTVSVASFSIHDVCRPSFHKARLTEATLEQIFR